MSRAATVASAALLALAPDFVHAQAEALLGPHPELLDRAYIFRNLPNDSTGEHFEGVLPVHVALHQGLQGAYDAVLDSAWKAHHAYSAHFSMVVNLRMTTESSAPVRTPSYMPKVTLTWFRVRRDQATTLPDSLPRSISMWAVPFIPYGHYSNGQDGCLFRFQEPEDRDDDGEIDGCADTSSVPRTREPTAADINRRDGSFSSHYSQLGLFYRRMVLDTTAQSITSAATARYWTVGAHVRAYQPWYWLGGGMSKELRELYGPTRIRLTANYVWQQERLLCLGPGQLRLEGFAEALPGASDEVDPVRISIEIARTLDRRGGWGLFLRGYSGQDDYNLGFLTNLRVVQFGAIVTGERMPTFRL